MNSNRLQKNLRNWKNTTSLLGRLSDVFDIRVGGFERTKGHIASGNEGGLLKSFVDIKRENVSVSFENNDFELYIDYYEILEPKTAETIGMLTNIREQFSVITLNCFGKGKAIYIAIPADKIIVKVLLNKLYFELNIKGVSARYIDQRRILYVNITPSTTGDTIFISGKRNHYG